MPENSVTATGSESTGTVLNDGKFNTKNLYFNIGMPTLAHYTVDSQHKSLLHAREGHTLEKQSAITLAQRETHSSS